MKKPRFTYNLKELLADFNQSAETTLLIANAENHYSTMNSGATALRQCIRREAYNMKVSIETPHLVIYKEK